MTSSPTIIADALTAYLKTKTIGQKILYLQTTDSTSNECRRRSSSETEGLVILSEQQTSGRGRLGRGWVSPKGKGIWMSLLLKPDLQPVKIPQLTLVAAASVCKALENEGIVFSPKVEIKWPNDILINGKKAGGILTEMQVSGDRVQSVVLGIGINVNLEKADFPEGLWDTATSLYLETGKVWERERLLAAIFNSFEPLYEYFVRNGSLGESLTICRQKSAVIGRQVVLLDKGVGQKAEVLNLGPQGELQVRFDDGKITSIVSGEISLRM